MPCKQNYLCLPVISKSTHYWEGGCIHRAIDTAVGSVSDPFSAELHLYISSTNMLQRSVVRIKHSKEES